MRRRVSPPSPKLTGQVHLTPANPDELETAYRPSDYLALLRFVEQAERSWPSEEPSECRETEIAEREGGAEPGSSGDPPADHPSRQVVGTSTRSISAEGATNLDLGAGILGAGEPEDSNPDTERGLPESHREAEAGRTDGSIASQLAGIPAAGGSERRRASESLPPSGARAPTVPPRDDGSAEGDSSTTAAAGGTSHLMPTD